MSAGKVSLDATRTTSPTRMCFHLLGWNSPAVPGENTEARRLFSVRSERWRRKSS
uniref:Uncharacterized protein n=1 Tax=Arundo donax TaxID=35708 RepID=A0A0A9G5U1_ARUDO